MSKDLIGFSLVLIGIIEIGNFFAHHESNIPVNDGNSHALVGVILSIVGVFLVKTELKFDFWTKLGK